jgi:2,4-dienoyl-CoA reductase-like NADH-dependent reductase (Old Yellow Enzyme family)/NADPH-dependent 2,4-dienoyl-CoA reductase/sulfur reductase-like enzyme
MQKNHQETSSTMGYTHILAPGRIGNMTLRNRIFMSPMGSNLAEEDGFCAERIAKYYETRAEGGAAMVIMGSVGIAYPRGSGNARQVGVSDDKYIPGLKLVADAVHRHGCRIALQLQHAGAVSVNEPPKGIPMLVPSTPDDKPYDWPQDLTPEEMEEMFKPMYSPEAKVVYHEATEDDIEWLIDCFAKAAVRAKSAGIDGVEIHAGHGYIISSFLSPSSNKRQDRWGGALENRARLLVEVIKRIKTATGTDYPVWFRLDSEEYLKDDGITLEDAIEVAKLGEAAGADAIHVTAYADATKGISFTEAHTTYIPCRYVSNAAAIKAAVKVPVICPGRIEADVGDRLIGEGKIDFVTMARKLLADPELPNKLAKGRPELIRPCIYCYTCISQIFVRRGVRCAVNAQTGFELERPIVVTPRRKKVLVVGGGPGGMEAARVATLRGHEVHLYDANPRLGGTVFFSSIVYPENGRLIEYLAAQMQDLKVHLHLGTRVTPELVAREKPDAVVVATGARRSAVPVPGADLPHVFSGDEMREMVTGDMGLALKRKLPGAVRFMIGSGRALGFLKRASMIRRMSEHWLPLGEHVAIYGGGLVGVELAEFLAERHRKVTLIEPGVTFGKELMMVRRWRIMDTLRKEGVRMLKSAELTRIHPDRVTYRTCTGQLQTVKADTVIMALGAQPSGDELAQSLKAVCPDVQCVGDAHELGYIDGAMSSGHRAGREV